MQSKVPCGIQRETIITIIFTRCHWAYKHLCLWLNTLYSNMYQIWNWKLLKCGLVFLQALITTKAEITTMDTGELSTPVVFIPVVKYYYYNKFSSANEEWSIGNCLHYVILITLSIIVITKCSFHDFTLYKGIDWTLFLILEGRRPQLKVMTRHGCSLTMSHGKRGTKCKLALHSSYSRQGLISASCCIQGITRSLMCSFIVSLILLANLVAYQTNTNVDTVQSSQNIANWFDKDFTGT